MKRGYPFTSGNLNYGYSYDYTPTSSSSGGGGGGGGATGVVIVPKTTRQVPRQAWTPRAKDWSRGLAFIRMEGRLENDV